MQQTENETSKPLEPLFPVAVDRRWGWIDRTGQVVIEPRFERCGLDAFITGNTFPFRENKKWGLADRNGNILIEPRFKYGFYFEEGIARVIEDDQIKYIDLTGETVTPPWEKDWPGAYVDRLPGGGLLIDLPEELPWYTRIIPSRRRANYKGEGGYIFLDAQGTILGRLPRGSKMGLGSEGLFPVAFPEEPSKWGFVDETGRFVIEPRFAAVGSFSEGLAPAAIATDETGWELKWGYIDRSGNFIIEPFFLESNEPDTYSSPLNSFHEGLAAIEILLDPVTGRRWDGQGFIDRTGAIAIEPRFFHVDDFSEGLAAVCMGLYSRRKTGFIDHSGSFIIPARFDSSYHGIEFHYGIVAVYIGDDDPTGGKEQGYIDKTGQCIWGSERFRRLLETTAPVTRPVPVVKVRSREAELSHLAALPAPALEPLFPIQENEKWGFINCRGEMVVEPQYDEVLSNFKDLRENKGWLNSSLLGVKSREKWGYINRAGELVIEPQYTWVRPFSEGLAAVSGSWRKQGYIDENGNLSIPTHWRTWGTFQDGLAPVTCGDPRTDAGASRVTQWLRHNNLWSIQGPDEPETDAFINHEGEIVFTLPKDWCSYGFSEGRALVSIGRRYGYIDTTGTLVTAPEFVGAQPFSEGYAAVAITRHSIRGWSFFIGFINPSGQYSIEPRFEVIPDSYVNTSPLNSFEEGIFSEGLAVIQALVTEASHSGFGYAYIDTDGHIVVPPRFCTAGAFSDGLARLGLPEFLCAGYIDRSGEFVIPPKFGPDLWGGHFHNGLARVNLNASLKTHDISEGHNRGEWGYINTLGECVWGSPQFRRFLEMEWW